MGSEGTLARAWVRVRRHARWARGEGVGRLIEEDDLDPVARVRRAIDRRRWRRRHPGIVPNAVPVFLVGVQRSGTNMLVRGLETLPEFDVCNENDGRAFERFRLRAVPEVRALVEASGHRFVLLKPLAESHRTVELLDTLGTPSRPLAIWAWRRVDGRVRSAVSKFGPNNLLALRAIASGERDRGWGVEGPAQEVVDMIAAGMSDESLEVVRSFDLDAFDAEAGAALFWYVRNRAFFELGLDVRDDVLCASYERVVASPETTMHALCEFLGVTYRPAIAAHVDRRSVDRTPLVLPADLRDRCDRLEAELAEAEERGFRRVSAATGSAAADRRLD